MTEQVSSRFLWLQGRASQVLWKTECGRECSWGRDKSHNSCSPGFPVSKNKFTVRIFGRFISCEKWMNHHTLTWECVIKCHLFAFSFNFLLQQVVSAVRAGVNPSENSFNQTSLWDISSSFFFAGTVITTIGKWSVTPRSLVLINTSDTDCRFWRFTRIVWMSQRTWFQGTYFFSVSFGALGWLKAW